MKKINLVILVIFTFAACEKRKDITSGIKLAILVDGKVYKQAFSQYDTIKYVIVSGTIPY